MARATRSQRPSQSQPPPKRGRRKEQSEDEDVEEDRTQRQGTQDDDGDENMEFDGGVGGSQLKKFNDGDLDRKANDLVRLALFNENRRVPLKRDEISKKILGSNSRSFNAVLERAQQTLRSVFGMELVELQSRAEREKEANARDGAGAEEGKKATGVKKKSVAAGSKTYILRSTLDPLIIEYAALTDEQILEAELDEGLSDDEDDSRSYGSVIAWKNSDHLGSIGILYVILALILVNGRVMADNDLRAVLKQFRLTPTALVSFDTKSTHPTLPMSTYLTHLAKQGYLDPSKVGEQKSGGKRGRAPAATQGGSNSNNNGDDGSSIEWKWGSRAHSEVGEQGIAKFVAEFMVERMVENDGDDDDGEQRNEEIQQKRLEVMMKGIQRAAAGGDLSDVR